MKVLVTGASGYIGRSLVPRLLAEHWDVVTVQRSAIPMDEGSGPAIIQGDLTDPGAAGFACHGVDIVIHLAGIAHVSASESDLRAVNLDATLNLAHAAKQAGVRRFIFISSSKARYPRNSAYGRLKAEAETRLLAMHEPGVFDVVCLRPALVYGPDMRGNLAGLLRLLQRKKLPAFISSDQRMGMIGREDLCQAIVLAVEAEGLCGAVWELSDGETYTLNAIVARARIMLGLQPPGLYLPRPLVQYLARAAQILSPLHRSSLSMSTYRTLFEEDYPPDARFAAATGFVPAENLYHSLPDLLGVPKA